jgi:hypothetical protein
LKLISTLFHSQDSFLNITSDEIQVALYKPLSIVSPQPLLLSSILVKLSFHFIVLVITFLWLYNTGVMYCLSCQVTMLRRSFPGLINRCTIYNIHFLLDDCIEVYNTFLYGLLIYVHHLDHYNYGQFFLAGPTDCFLVWKYRVIAFITMNHWHCRTL